AIDPNSEDVKTYLGLHYARGKDWQKAVPLLEQVVAQDPDRLPAIEALALIRERQGRIDDAIRLRQKIYSQRPPSARELVQIGEMAMAVGETAVAIDAFERACRTDFSPSGRAEARPTCGHDLQLGVLYLAAGRLPDARDALDRVPPCDPGYAMALFKRAQVSVLLHEADAGTRIESAREHADATTRLLIDREGLFH